MEKKTILVVGGAGFIGSHINKMLNLAGFQTIVLDNLSLGNRLTVPYGQFIEGDMGDRPLLNQIFQDHKIDAVMHFGAFIDVGESVKDPAKYYLNNVSKTQVLLQALLHYQIKTFIFSSTAAIFGYPETRYISENHPCHPINPYGEGKLMVEKILRDFDAAYGLRFCSFRYFNAAGGDPQEEIKNYQTRSTNLIPIVLRSLKTGSIVTINGNNYPTPDGTCVRDYIHIDDLGSAHIKGMEELFKGASSNYYNLGNGEGYSIREVINTVQKVTGMKVKTQDGPRRPGDPPILVADSSKASTELGWKPKYNLETMILHAWRAMQ